MNAESADTQRHADVAGQAEAAETAVQAPPSRGEWLWSRVAGQPEALRKQVLANAGISLEDQGSAPSEAVRIRDSDWGFARLPSLDEMFEAAQAGQATPLLEGLRLSRTFNSPDCVDSMAEVLRISRAVEGLKGSAATPARSPASEEALDDLRASLRAGIKAAWSREAVRQGVAAAKVGDYEGAHKSYARALELDRRNVDAWVARGAAYANQRHYQRAATDFETALEIKPEDANAAKYLSATRQRMAQLGLKALPAQLRSPGPPEASPVAAPGPAGVEQPRSGAGAAGLDRGQSSARASPAPPAGLAGDAGDAVAGDPDNGVHSDSSRSGDNMDLQKALKIVAKHYSRRNVQIITACCRSRSLLFLVFLTSCSRQQHPTMCGVGRGPVRRDRMRERADAHSKRKRQKSERRDASAEAAGDARRKSHKTKKRKRSRDS